MTHRQTLPKRRTLAMLLSGLVIPVVGTPQLVRAATWSRVRAKNNSSATNFTRTWDGVKWVGTYTLVIANNTVDINLRTAALNAGWNGADYLVASIAVGASVYVGSSSTAGFAFDTGVSFPGGSSLTLTINGSIQGAPGAPSSNGGPALRAQAPITIINNGTIGGGGGGGGTGGANSYECGGGYASYIATGLGGIGGYGAGNGSGPTGGQSGSSIPSMFCPPIYGSPGGAGGGLGAAGSSGVAGNSAPAATSGGSPGAAVAGNAFITWSVAGTILGTIS